MLSVLQDFMGSWCKPKRMEFCRLCRSEPLPRLKNVGAETAPPALRPQLCFLRAQR